MPFSVASQHNLCLDNCHSHVAMALNLMRYDNSSSWNMVNLCIRALINGKHVRSVLPPRRHIVSSHMMPLDWEDTSVLTRAEFFCCFDAGVQ